MTEKRKLGRNQWIGVTAIAVPFVAATTFVVLELGGANAQWWGGFVGTLIPIGLGIILGGSAAIKGLQARGGSSQ